MDRGNVSDFDLDDAAVNVSDDACAVAFDPDNACAFAAVPALDSVNVYAIDNVDVDVNANAIS